MATKKQKREAALAKRAEYMEKIGASGLAAQQVDREERARMDAEFKKFADEMNERHRQVLDRHMARSTGISSEERD